MEMTQTVMRDLVFQSFPSQGKGHRMGTVEVKGHLIYAVLSFHLV